MDILQAVEGVTQPEGTVHLAYTKRQQGWVPFTVNGRAYRGRAGSSVFAHKDDVARLVGLGAWAVVPTPVVADEVAIAEKPKHKR